MSCARCAPIGGCPCQRQTRRSWQQQSRVRKRRRRLWTRRTSTPLQPPSLRAWRHTTQVSVHAAADASRRVCSWYLVGACMNSSLVLVQSALGSVATRSRAFRSPATCRRGSAPTFHPAGSVPNILNTISKLHAFEWNQPPAVPGQRQQRQGAAPQQQQWQQDAAPSGSTAERSADPAPGKRQQHIGTVLCPICLAPLADDELPGSSALLGSGSRCEHTSGGQGAAAAAAAAGCCLSCYAQIMAGCSAPGSGAAPAVAANGCGVSSSSPVLAALPAALSQRMAALAAAGQSAAGAVAAEPASAACDGPADASSCTLERLRSQIAEFLLE